MISFFFFCFLIVSISGEDAMEWKLSGGFRSNAFNTVINMGTNSAGGPLQTFDLLVDLETSATLIPSKNCVNCKVGAGYDRELSQTEEVIPCGSNYCDKNNQQYCPQNHSGNGQCCSNFEKTNCGWDSRIGVYSSSFFADGTIVRDEFIFTSNRFSGYFVEVFNSTFDDLPGTAVGILGLGEKACNPTCIDPIYNTVRDSVSYASNVFTMCFGHRGGILAMGKNDHKYYKGDVFYTTQRPNEMGYTYDILDLRVNNQTITDFSSYIGVIKSKINGIYLPSVLFHRFRYYMEIHYPDLPGVEDGSLFKGATIHDISKFPTFDIRFSGVLVHLSPQQYFMNLDPTVNDYNLDINESNRMVIELGLVFLRGFTTIFDQERTGFATARKENCLASDDMDAVGSVEWAPVVGGKWPTVISNVMFWMIVALVVVVVICLDAIFILKGKNAKLTQQFGYSNMADLPQSRLV